MATDLPALLAKCTPQPAMPEVQQAFTGRARRTQQMKDDPQTGAEVSASRMHARQEAHAELVHIRFMHKLRGTRQAAEGKEETVHMEALSAVANEGTGAGPTGAQDGIGEALSVTEQVGVLINEATSLDNLAQMYEGWSAWI